MKTSLSIWSCHSKLFSGEWSNADFIAFAQESGAEGVELLSMFWKPESDIPAVEAALAQSGLKLACFGACNNLAEPDDGKRREQVEDILRSVDAAVHFGAKVVRVFAGDVREGLTIEAARAWIIDGLKEAANYAESKGIVLSLENHGRLAGKGTQVLGIIEDVGSPALRSTYDMGNFLLVDENPVTAYEQLTGRITHVHVKDFKELSESDAAAYPGNVYKSDSGRPFIGVVPGDGNVIVADRLAALRSSGYDGWLTVEYEGDEDQQEGSRRAVAYVNQHR
ncbi:sugar phosphate isomerase/epimerase [Paenibacillus phyllosphaerae]|uniref:Sugar phosphate isomerase/epimerase n=1 Tax=Paenibacillus phyllosphaerae TaxID=274593 RepID=A0A7W5AYR4_9BACL|nr:sugar phosphate isomerase/epimerase [Paenibacillus phyllosphaerae]MBB3111203.1 sugar phosphate isomerase/epimerase [Paenibacillus phyllosphaerae]